MNQQMLHFEKPGFDCGPLFASGLSQNNRARKLHTYKIRRAKPCWLLLEDRQKINGFYQLSKDLTHATGFQHSVDHIVPLSHPLVCGLHVPWNLEVALLEDNIRKGNNRWPDMPEAQGRLF